MKNIACPYCNSNKVKFFRYRELANGNKKPRYRCTECRKTFVESVELLNPVVSFIEYRMDGSVAINQVLAMTDEDKKDPNRVLELCGLDPARWKVKTCKINVWNAQRPKDIGQLINHQVTVIAVLRQPNDITLKDLDKFYSNFSGKQSKIVVSESKNNGTILELILADLHVGGNDDDIEMLCDEVVNKIISEVSKQKFEKILLVFLGDTYHFDTMNKTTTMGTQLESKLSPYSMFDLGSRIIIKQINKLAKIAPVEVIPIYGNHDRFISYALFKGLEWYYKNVDKITIDTNYEYTKFKVFGECLIVWNHGDLGKKPLENLIYNIAREEFGKTKYAEVHVGDLHTESTTEIAGGVKVRRISSISTGGEWYKRKGLIGNLRGTSAFVWDKSEGLKKIIFGNL